MAAITGTPISVVVPGTSNYMVGQIVWSYTQDIDANQSTITATLQYKCTGAQTSRYGANVSNFYIDIDGDRSVWPYGTSANGTQSTAYYITSSWTTIFSKTVTVTHDASGAKSVSISAGGGISSTSGLPNSNTPNPGPYQLQRIPRGSTIASIEGSTIGSTITITLNDPTGSLNYHKLEYTFEGATTITGRITSTTLNKNTTFTWTPAYATFGAAIPDRTSGVLTITLTSHTSSSGSSTTNQRGDPSVQSITLTMPNNSSTQPSTNAITVEDTAYCRDSSNGTIASYIGKYARGYSKPKFTTTAATGKYSATIASYSFSFDGVVKSGSGLTQTFGAISARTNQTCTMTVTDSRGFTAQRTLSVTIADYVTPSITAYNIKRSQTTTTTVTAKATAKAFYIQNNTLQIFVAYKLTSAAYYGSETELTGGTSSTSGTSGTSGATRTLTNATADLTNLSEQNTYQFKLIAKDAITTYSQEYKVGTAEVGLHIGSNYLGVGKIRERGALDVGGNGFFKNNIYVGQGKTGLQDGLMGTSLGPYGLYLQSSPAEFANGHVPSICFYGHTGATSNTSGIWEYEDGELTVKADRFGFRGNPISGSTPSWNLVVPMYTNTDVGWTGATGPTADGFLTAWIQTICNKYKDGYVARENGVNVYKPYQDTMFVGTVKNSSKAMVFWFCYDISRLQNQLPEYSFGLVIPWSSSTAIKRFGTNSYTFWSSTL